MVGGVFSVVVDGDGFVSVVAGGKRYFLGGG